jgi:hypothetical protein
MGYGNYSLEAHKAITKAHREKGREVFTSTKTDPRMRPHGVRFRESRDSAAHPESLSIVLALDVSGSMGEIPRQLATETLPHFMEHVLAVQPHAQVMFMAIGNAYTDESPLQVGQFESDAALMDQWIRAIHLEGKGGGLGESYDIAMYFAARHLAMDCWEKRKKKGYFFLTGDETPFFELNRDHVRGLLGEEAPVMTINDVTKEVLEKFEVFFLFPDPERAKKDIFEQVWRIMLHERVVVLEQPSDTAHACATLIAIEEGATDAARLEAWCSQRFTDAALVARVVKATMPFALARAKGPIAPPGQLYLRKDTPKMEG